MNKTILYIRKETIPNEYRTPLIPKHVDMLLDKGFIVYVQSSNQRIFTDESYVKNGAILTNEPWYSPYFDLYKKNMIVIGLKELKDLYFLSEHTHMYFSHSFKGQPGAYDVISHFKHSRSLLYDIEYIIDENNKRLISFSYFAGISGCLLGLLHYYKKLEYPLKPFENFHEALLHINNKKHPFIKIIGNGQCTKGVLTVLNILNIPYTILERKDIKDVIPLDFDILFNCIKLDEEEKSVFLNDESVSQNQTKKIVVDISCDIGKQNNPLPIYKKETTWEEPVYHHPNYIDIISISNLPSLLPKESSEYFSEKLYTLLLYNDHIGWKQSLKSYLDVLYKQK